MSIHALAFDDAAETLESALSGSARRDIVTDLAGAKVFRKALQRLRERMRTHVWPAGTLTPAQKIDAHDLVAVYDERTRRDGFHVLHDWDGKADRVNEDIIPIDVLNYFLDRRGDAPLDTTALAILVDYYFFHLLALLSLRIWDNGRADSNLDRLDRLLRDLQGSGGSGHQFVADAETLILVATSHYEIHEPGYDALLARVRTLNASHRTPIALGHAASMGCHLRFAFEATCGRDTVAVRDDNVTDYPWLSFALVHLMREYAAGMAGDEPRPCAPDVIVEALLNGLTPDARAFVGAPPRSLSACAADRLEFLELFNRHKTDLLKAFEAFRPTDSAYSPIALFFNFSHNVVKGTVVDALLRGEAWTVPLNDLLTGAPHGEPASEARTSLATTLMGYARANPDTIRGQPMPVIVYDPSSGREAWSVTMRKLRE